ncbi:MAG: sulfotransferase domain-containing protein [Hyphomicrobiales bacterium]|nr:sulfotransferase domain-containing protein [Hyphomicrobiales bacterium]
MGKILWLASYPKSGNTWLRVFLANYAQSGGKPFDINRLPDVSFSDSRAAYFEQIAGCPPDELTFEAVHRLRPDVQRLLVQARTDQVWVKTHSAVAVLDDVPTIVPELTSAAIYVVRNPLDVVVSFAHHYGLPMDRAVRAIGFRELKTSPQDGMVAQFLSDWSSHAKSWLTATRYCVHVVRYEDMIARPLRTFAEIVRGRDCAWTGSSSVARSGAATSRCWQNRNIRRVLSRHHEKTKSAFSAAGRLAHGVKN